MVLDDPLRIEPRIRRNPGKSRKRLACGVFGVQDDGAIQLFRTGHGISKEFVARRHDLGVDGKVRPSYLAEGNRPSPRDVGGSEVDPFPDRVHRGRQSEALPKVEEVHRIRAKGHKHLHAGRAADGIGHQECLLVRGSIVLAAVNRDIVVGSVRQEERGPTGFLERLRREDALELGPEVDVVVKDREPRRHSTLLPKANLGSRIRSSRPSRASGLRLTRTLPRVRGGLGSSPRILAVCRGRGSDGGGGRAGHGTLPAARTGPDRCRWA